MENNNNGINEEFAVALKENIATIGKLSEEINMDTLEPKVQKFISRLMMFLNQSKMIANAAEIKAIEFNNNLLINSEALAEESYQRWMLEPMNPEVHAACSKALVLWKAIEDSSPAALKGLLFDASEAFSDYNVIVGEGNYFRGFHDGLTIQKGQA